MLDVTRVTLTTFSTIGKSTISGTNAAPLTASDGYRLFLRLSAISPLVVRVDLMFSPPIVTFFSPTRSKVMTPLIVPHDTQLKPQNDTAGPRPKLWKHLNARYIWMKEVIRGCCDSPIISSHSQFHPFIVHQHMLILLTQSFWSVSNLFHHTLMFLACNNIILSHTSGAQPNVLHIPYVLGNNTPLPCPHHSSIGHMQG